MRKILTLTVVALALAGAALTHAEDKWTPKTAFERMKKLGGDWFMKDGGDKPFLTIRVVSQGSAIIETIGPGTPHEMVTVYHMDGDNLVLTHYCGLKNQPRMKAQKITEKTVEFRFDGGTNVDPAKDHFMGDLDLTFVGDDEIKEVWSSYQGKTKEEPKVFELKRKK